MTVWGGGWRGRARARQRACKGAPQRPMQRIDSAPTPPDASIPHHILCVAAFSSHATSMLAPACNRDAAAHRLGGLTASSSSRHIASEWQAGRQRDMSGAGLYHRLGQQRQSCARRALRWRHVSWSHLPSIHHISLPISIIVPTSNHAARHARTRFDHGPMSVPRSRYWSD